MRNQRSFHDPLDYKLVIQPGSEEYKAYIRSLRRAANESKRVNRFLHDENIEKIARYFALTKHVPSKQEALLLESQLIKKYNSIENGYNVSSYGNIETKKLFV